MKKVIIISDSFKGTLSSQEICAIARESVSKIFPGCEVVGIPVADAAESAAYYRATLEDVLRLIAAYAPRGV